MRRELALLAVALVGCSEADTKPPETKPGETTPEPAGWQPGQVLPSDPAAAPDGMLHVRGLIHAHSVYSHDACDGEPRDASGNINEPCFDDFRRDMCTVAHDFVMLTDHDSSFSRSEFPDVLLYRQERGDVLLERDATPVANVAGCDGSEHTVLLLAGTESDTMPVGLEGHVAATEETRNEIYNATTPDAVLALQAQGGVVLAQHTEDWTAEQLRDLGFDGFEMFNLHAAAIRGAGGLFELMAAYTQEPETLMHPDIAMLNALSSEDPRYLETWAGALSMGQRFVTTMGTDCHRNTFQTELSDGERMDSYRRMMLLMSNHLLITPEADGSWDDRHLKDALREGRLYGVFELLGYAEGFVFEGMGDEVAAPTTLVVQAPRVRDVDPQGEQPIIRLRLLRAEGNGWLEVDAGEGDLSFDATVPGAYRVEARITPKHLRAALNGFGHLADEEFVWIYSNPIYVTGS